MTAPGITVIIVSKGLDALLNQCLINLGTALKALDPDSDTCTVVVDNASELPYRKNRMADFHAHLIRLDKAHSFSAANNLAARLYPNNRYLMLNNDVLLHQDTIAAMMKVLKSRPDAGICGARMLFADGTVQHCGVVFGPGAIGPYHCMRKRPNHLVPRMLSEYQAVTGACFMVRDTVWSSLGGLDESYPFGLEDIDFCLRARLAGWRVFCENSTDSLHFESTTPGRVKKDVGSRKHFMKQWSGRYTIDG
ncbi:MAG: glycosyltransferase [Pseudomonadota bacterium]